VHLEQHDVPIRCENEGMLVAPNVPSISVVVCAYSLERWSDLLAATASVGTQTLQPLELVVVIDHNEHLLERAQRQFAAAAHIRVVANESRQGLSGARNTGVAVASGDVIAFLDDDAVADPSWLERLAEPYAREAVVAVGGAIEPRWAVGRPRTFPPEFDWVVGCTYRGHPTTAQPVRNLIGANMSFRRSALQAVGGFRFDIGRIGSVPLGCEETELCLRAKQAAPDAVILYEPSARVLHSVPRERGTLAYFVRRCYGEGISKAVVARLAGRQEGLRTERRYVADTLRRAFVDNLAAGSRGDAAGLGRAARIVVGLAAATAGYCRGSAIRVRAAPLEAGSGSSR
jgi:GT2 family glycosyltransferase